MRELGVVVFVLLLSTGSTPAASTTDHPSLAEVFAVHFAIGMGVDGADLDDPATWSLVRHHAATVTLENALKPQVVQPAPGRFDFEPADRLVDAARAAGLRVHGHTLVWHRHAPEWLFLDTRGHPAEPAQVLERLRNHITTVVQHFRGRVESWDVVNEALAEGGYGLRDSPWLQALGPDYLIEAFRAAETADPEALLFYNDYDLASRAKREQVLALVERLRAAGVRIDGIGMQGHLSLDWPAIEQLEDSLRAFHAAGLVVRISELDVTVFPRNATTPNHDPYAGGLPEDRQAALARRYAALFAGFVRHRDAIVSVTFWNTHDGRSWLNHHGPHPRTDHPLLFDRDRQPKPAFFAVIEQAAGD